MSHFIARVDLHAVRHNFDVVRSLAGEREILACVKGNAYGHGLLPVARTLEAAGARWLSTANPDEAAALAESVACRVLLFPTIAGQDVAALARRGVSIGVQSAEEAAAVARSAGGRASIFLKVDAGLGRVGIPLPAAVDTARAIAKLPGASLDGVFTHLPFGGAESLPWVRDRLKAFGEAADAIRALGSSTLLVQSLASTAIACGLDGPGTNAVCPGSLVYGLRPSWTGEGAPSVPDLRPALIEVVSVIGSLRDIPQGAHFSGGGMRTATRATRVGVLPIGMSNSILMRKPAQTVGLRGRRAPILSVSLEHTVVDITDVPGVAEGDVVHLLARDAGVGPTLEEVATAQGRIAVEVLVALTGRVSYEYVG